MEFNSTVCLYFESDVPLRMSGESYLIINSNEGELIDHLLIISDVVPTSATEGKTLISVSIVGDKEFLEEKMQSELIQWFGRENVWRHLKTYPIPHALPQYFQDSATENNLKINEYTYRCGD